jgi:hypothetical protein
LNVSRFFTVISFISWQATCTNIYFQRDKS